MTADRRQSSRRHGIPMIAAKPITRFSIASLICSIAAWLVLPLLLTINPAAGAGVSGGLAILCVASTAGIFALLGVLLGIIALRKIRGGEFGGRKCAWAGIVAGALPIVGVLAWIAPAWWTEIMIQLGYGDYIIPA